MESNNYENGIKHSGDLAQALLKSVNRLWRELTLKGKPSTTLARESIFKINSI